MEVAQLSLGGWKLKSVASDHTTGMWLSLALCNTAIHIPPNFLHYKPTCTASTFDELLSATAPHRTFTTF
ncbi:hypothetical protein QC761_0054840 [Podospora bellae-mahoneyi]|uniref:Uncharacterized protein n=1 Tax=Podospora bellae-mahoneyi TaxID=2093777 RepID=A0ABR0FL28_9PEZI|nr:hypothetical protein QC761_0054840 [Podospora bellae-mahoneyi]